MKTKIIKTKYTYLNFRFEIRETNKYYKMYSVHMWDKREFELKVFNKEHFNLIDVYRGIRIHLVELNEYVKNIKSEM